MNRFRTRRRAKDDSAAPPKAAPPKAAPPNMPAEAESSSRFRLFGQKKSQEEEKKKEIDLTNVLPPSDDFRTSLLMNGLSARFSMLREQDDPNTKIGKASDDSVLYPKRQSRMMDMGFRGLGDIAEVESIRAPPSFTRMDSYQSSDDADSTKGGSIMNRGKPTEGNILFGGRQKVYKIPVGAQSSKAGNGGMGGRAVYEDDIALSAFQKWKQAERERRTSDENERRDETYIPPLSRDREAQRPESPPPVGYNHRRETNSTTSSAPSVGRNSTAATSIISQPTPSTKDWPSSGTSTGAVSPTPPFEKTTNVARTRRLYEQSLSQELHDQQSQAMSRMDTISRKLGTRTPDLSQNSSPTGYLFADRPADRKLLSKASAPNPQTAQPNSPPSSASTTNPPMDLGIKVNGLTESKSYGAAPPLSPPISETEDHPMLPIQPGDKGKATALGVFQKPAQPYDESRYAQRQIQLQQGRDTPTQRFRAESNASYDTARSGSTSSTQRKPLDRMEPLSIKTELPSRDKIRTTFLFDDGDDADDLPSRAPARQIPAPPPGQARPSDQEHPAFRSSALPTPLSFSSKVSDEPSPLLERPELQPPSSQSSPDDSPTLGPGTGLSGMVRQHLRTDSGASSVYGGQPTHASVMTTKFPSDPFDSKALEDLGVKSNPWSSVDWTSSFYAADEKDKSESFETKLRFSLPQAGDEASRDTGSSSEMEKEHDEFHHQLADGARRVRERLTSYVEADGTSTLGPLPMLPALPALDPAVQSPIAKPNPLGLRKSKSSRASLADRSNRDTKTMKLLGIGNSTISSTPSPNKQTFEERDPLSPMQEEFEFEPANGQEEAKREQDVEQDQKDDENADAGLRKFRQARRELQRLKEVETQKRHQAQQEQELKPKPDRTPPIHGAPQHATPSRERKPPPVFYQRRDQSQESNSQPGSRATSRPPSRTERDRSGSETSSGSRSGSRPPPRPRNGPFDSYHHQYGPNGAPRQGPPAARSPGLPGTDIKRSPIMPPQPYPGTMSPARFERGGASQNLTVSANQRGLHSGQPSPISPMGDLPSPYGHSGATTPTGFVQSPRRPSAPPTPGIEANNTTIRLDETMKRFVKKKDISEPTFVSTTSRVPTVNLPEQSSSRSRGTARSRSGSLLQSLTSAASTPNLLGQAHAPPVPPLNPKRRNVLGNLMGRKGDDDLSLSTPHLPFVPMNNDSGDDNRSAFSVSDDEELSSRDRRKLRKATSEVNFGRVRSRGNSPPYVEARPAPRSPLATPNGAPGGMI